jgi:hypothetical protein
MNRLPLALTALVLTLCVHTADAAKHKARKAAPTPKPTPCSVHCLDALMDQYLDALIQHKPGNVKHAVKFKYTENGEPLKLGEGLWRKISSIGKYHRVFYDSLSQQAVFIGVVNEGTEAAIAALRIGIEGGRIIEIEHIVARKGSHPLFAPDKLIADPSLTESIDQDQRVSRTRMVAIASSYLDGIEQHSSANIKAAETCQRVENGVQTTNRPGGTSRNCQDSANVLTYIKAVQNRRFPIVDPEHGIVVATFLFDIPGEIAPPPPAPTPAAEASPAEAPAESTAAPTSEATPPPPPAAEPTPPPVAREPRTLLLTEWFRIDHGAIQRIEAVMHNLPHGSKSGWELEED